MPDGPFLEFFRADYFTDSGIIGSREFVENGFRAVRHLLKSKDERRFTAIGGMPKIVSAFRA